MPDVVVGQNLRRCALALGERRIRHDVEADSGGKCALNEPRNQELIANNHTRANISHCDLDDLDDMSIENYAARRS